MDLTAPGLENPMVRLEPMAEHHRSIIFASDIEGALWKWMPALRGGTNLENYFEALMKAQNAGIAVTYAVFRQEDGAFAGVTGFNEINKLHRRIRNALTWHPPHMTSPTLFLAGQLAMIQRAYDWRARRLEWQINPDNQYMMSHLAEIGPTQEARYRNYERTADGVWVDKIVYAMTRPEIAGAITRLQTELF